MHAGRGVRGGGARGLPPAPRARRAASLHRPDDARRRRCTDNRARHLTFDRNIIFLALFKHNVTSITVSQLAGSMTLHEHEQLFGVDVSSSECGPTPSALCGLCPREHFTVCPASGAFPLHLVLPRVTACHGSRAGLV